MADTTPVNSQLLTREKLQQFLKTPELIRAFEQLSADVVTILPANEAAILSIARAALALAAQAFATASEAQESAEQAPPIPGPRGQTGAAGLPGPAALMFSEEQGEAWPPLMQPTIDPRAYFYHGPAGYANPVGRGPYFGTGFSGRQTIFLEALQNATDLVFRALLGQGQVRFADESLDEYFSVDFINLRINCYKPVVMKVYTVATLPPPSGTIPPGSRAMVSDALGPVFGNVVAGGGAVTVPVYVDGAGAWRVG